MQLGLYALKLSVKEGPSWTQYLHMTKQMARGM